MYSNVISESHPHPRTSLKMCLHATEYLGGGGVLVKLRVQEPSRQLSKYSVMKITGFGKQHDDQKGVEDYK
jgi:hypothetical protein